MVGYAYGECAVGHLHVNAVVVHVLLEAVGSAHHAVGEVVIGPSVCSCAPATAAVFGKVLRVYAHDGYLLFIGIEVGGEFFGAVDMVVVGPVVVGGAVVALYRQAVFAVGHGDGLMDVECAVPELHALVAGLLARGVARIFPTL